MVFVAPFTLRRSVICNPSLRLAEKKSQPFRPMRYFFFLSRVAYYYTPCDHSRSSSFRVVLLHSASLHYAGPHSIYLGVPLSGPISICFVRPPFLSGLFSKAFIFTSGRPHFIALRAPVLQASPPPPLIPAAALSHSTSFRSFIPRLPFASETYPQFDFYSFIFSPDFFGSF